MCFPKVKAESGQKGGKSVCSPVSLFDYPRFFPNKMATHQGKNVPKWCPTMGIATQQERTNRVKKKVIRRMKTPLNMKSPF